MVIHEESYKGVGIAPFIHRSRLRHFLRIFQSIPRKNIGTIADYGCSNGYVISLLRQQLFRELNYRFYGFDHSTELLQRAESKRIPGTVFHYFDLNKVNKDWQNAFDIVLCLETLEHVGNYKNAIYNLYLSCRKNGIIIISIPNEQGILGILKYFTRWILSKNVYGDFFKNRSKLKYIKHLFLNKPIDIFREPEADGWGPHLGFDWKVFKRHLEDKYTHAGRLKFRLRLSSPLRFSFFYVLEKIG